MPMMHGSVNQDGLLDISFNLGGGWVVLGAWLWVLVLRGLYMWVVKGWY